MRFLKHYNRKTNEPAGFGTNLKYNLIRWIKKFDQMVMGKE